MNMKSIKLYFGMVLKYIFNNLTLDFEGPYSVISFCEIIKKNHLNITLIIQLVLQIVANIYFIQFFALKCLAEIH